MWIAMTGILLLVALVVIFILLRKKTLHVAKWGKDSTGPLRGTLFRPYLTIQAAANRLPSCIDKHIVIKIHSGSYTVPAKFNSTFKGKGMLTLQGKRMKDVMTRIV